MGKKCKKKIQWRALSLNELSNKKASDDACGQDCDQDPEPEKSSCTPPTPHHRPQGPPYRRPFHPNLHPGDHRRFPHPHFDPRGPPFERGPSLERCPPPKYFGRPFHGFEPRPPFPGPPRRRPFKFYGRGGLYVRGPSPYGRDGGPKRRWSEDEGLSMEDPKEDCADEGEDGERPSQPVHTVLINNEEYTKIQTPRQEVIFKKSSLDRKRDSLDLGSSTCESLNSQDPNSQGDQASLAGSVEDATLSSSEDAQQDGREENGLYEDANNMFLGEPGKPPLAGVVMQQAYPGGPMVSIPVHWTPYLDPGLIPGDTALTPLDPSFTHVIDPKDLPVDPAHILPVQHDSNGCPVTVQVKIDCDGHPIEIEPSAFTVSLSSLEPRQQEVLLHRSSDLFSNSQVPPQSVAKKEEGEEIAVAKEETKEEEEEPKAQEEEEKEEVEVLDKMAADPHKDSEDCSSDSQYASMSEASSAPTTPSGELSDPSDASESSKSKSNKVALESTPKNDPGRISRSDSLLDSDTLEGAEDPCPSFPLSSVSEDDRLEGHPSDLEAPPSKDEALTQSTTPEQDPSDQLPESDSPAPSQTTDSSSSSNKKKGKRNKRRSLSLESNLSSQNSSLADLKVEMDLIEEPTSKYQAKKSAKKSKKEKRQSKDRNKAKSKASQGATKTDSPAGGERKDSIPPAEDSQSVTHPEDDSSDPASQNRVEVASVEDIESVLCEAVGEEEEEGMTKRGEERVSEEDTREEMAKQDPPEASAESREGENETSNEAKPDEQNLEIDSKRSEEEGNEIEPCAQEDLETSNEEERKTKMDETSSQDEEEEEEEGEKEEGSTLKEEECQENYVCKPGFVLVPILTPYYDPAVLYGYPMIIPENPPDRNFNRKKKKKYKKKYQEEMYLDTEHYAGEPFVATPNGYIMPMDTSQICHVHGYQYMPTMYPPILPDEGFVSIEHSPYLPEIVPESMYHNGYYEHGERHPRARYPRYHHGERRPAAQVHHEGSPTDQKPPKDFNNESCDSGVSESEELSHLTPGGKDSQEEGVPPEKEEEKEEGKEKEEEEGKEEKAKPKKEARKKSKRKEKSKPREVMEILEPDFSSFSGPTLKFESVASIEEKQKQAKKPKGRKKRPKDKSASKKEEEEKESPERPAAAATKQSTPPKDNTNSIPQTKSKKSKAKQSSESQTDASSKPAKTEAKDKGESPPTPKKKRAGKKRSKASKTDAELLKGVEKEGSDVASPSLCLGISDDPSCEDDCLSQESENVTTLSEDASQESELAGTEDCCSQESENIETCDASSQEDESMEECFIQETEEGQAVEECFSPESASRSHSPSPSPKDSLARQDEESEGPVSKSFSVQTFSSSSGQVGPSSPLSSLEEKSELCSSDSEQISCTPLSEALLHKESPVELEEHYSPLPEQELQEQVVPVYEQELQEPLASVSEQELQEQLSRVSEQELEEQPSPVSESDPGEQFPPASSSFRDLGVTEAVRRWIRDVTPEKAFSLSEDRRSLLFSSVVCPSEEESEPSDEEDSSSEEGATLPPSSEQESKNVRGNPSVAPPSDHSRGGCSERVAPHYAPEPPARAPFGMPQGSIDVLDDYDGESDISTLSRGRLFSSSSCSSFQIGPHLEDPLTPEDPRLYDPSVYSKYYQLGADAPSNTSTRESTLSPGPLESGSEDVDLLEDEEGARTPTPASPRSMSLATELLKAEKIRSNMAHISPSLCREDSLPSPHCGCPSSSLGGTNDPRPLARATAGTDQAATSISNNHGPLCSVSSSGIGSSLASTPNLSPAHHPQTAFATPKPKLEPHPLKNLSVGDGPLPCRAVCCAVM